jgi:hypothetical protein
MCEMGDSDVFVVCGQRVEMEKGLRYIILLKNGRIYEGVYRGLIEYYPLRRTVALANVTEITESDCIADEEAMFYSFEEFHIIRIEKTESDYSAMLEPNRPDYNYGAGLN